MIEQYSEDWFQARLGKVTASRVSDVVARTKAGWGASRFNYQAQLIAERLTGVPGERYSNAVMQWGVDHEAEAIKAYEFYSDVETAPCGFIEHPKIAMAGASPDRRAGADGLIECKCPLTSTHIDTLLNQSIDGKYVKQMQWQMSCTGTDWCDFISFDPRMPESMQLFIKRVERDDELITELEEKVIEFLSELNAKIEALSARYFAGESPVKVALQASLISHDEMMQKLEEPPAWT